MPAELTATGFPAVLVVAGTLAGIVSIYLFSRDRSEVGSKWFGSGIGLIALGIVVAAIF